MAITTPVYSTREEVKLALDVKSSLRDDALVDRAIQSAATDIHGLLHRRFFPEDAVKYFDWPNYQYAVPWRLWFDQYDLVSATQVTSGGVTIPLNEIFFEPVNKESDEPYTYMELDRSTNASFGVGNSPQRDIAITGTWGYSASTSPAGALNLAMNDTTGTSATITDSSLIGTGQIILIGSERMLVSDRSMTTTGVTLTGNIDASNATVSVPVSNGAELFPGEIILVDSERMLITDVSGNTLTVKRAQDGSVLAAHNSGAAVSAPRLLTVVRAALGTTGATHSLSASVSKFTFPGLVHDLAVALAENNVLQATSGYSRTVGEGDNLRNASGAGLADLISRAVAAYGRKNRSRVI